LGEPNRSNNKDNKNDDVSFKNALHLVIKNVGSGVPNPSSKQKHLGKTRVSTK